jgi:hypothetical protein
MNLFNDSVNVGGLLMFMIFWTIIYIPLIWYFEKIMPKQFGISLPFYFIFQRSYWQDDELSYAANILKNHQAEQKSADSTKLPFDETHFEEEPAHTRPSVVLTRVSKVYPSHSILSNVLQNLNSDNSN